jgi:hypothetical protein
MPFLGKKPTEVASPVDINSGSIDGTTIGGGSASPATVTTFTSNGIDDNADATAITIDSSENVGIGTASPQEQLHVYTTGVSRIEVESTTNVAGLKATNNQGSYAWYVDSSADKFHLYDFTDSANRLTFDGAGDVGIGVSDPLYKLQVAGPTADADGALGSQSPQFSIQGGNANNQLEFGMDNSGATAIGFIQSRNLSAGAQTLSLNPAGGKVTIGAAPANGLLTLQDNVRYSQLVELYGSGNRSTYIAGRFGIIENNSFSCKIGGVYGGYAGFSFEYYYVHPLIQETRNNGDLRLGESSYRFHTVYAVNGVSTSDERTKEEIENLDVGLDFIKSLQPKKFKYKDKNEEGIYKDGRLDQPNGVKKWGLIAQDVKQVLDDNSITEDLGLWSVDKGECNGEILEDQQQLQYQELIAPLINAVKEQQIIIENLQTRLSALEAN